jgi:hypothetical protein
MNSQAFQTISDGHEALGNALSAHAQNPTSANWLQVLQQALQIAQQVLPLIEPLFQGQQPHVPSAPQS